MIRADDPGRRLKGFLSRYTPEVAAQARQALAKMRRLVPGAVELVYDNYNALVIAFGPSERASEATFSIAVYPRWVSVFFVHGATLPDPDRLLRGSGKQVRHIVLTDAARLDEPGVRRLLARALLAAPKPINRAARRRTVIRSVSAKQRPRRAAAGRPVRASSPRPRRRP
jgi:hypothetical protein